MTNALFYVIIITEREVNSMMTTNEMIKYDMMVEYEVATVEELNLARCLLNGSWNEVLDSVCYVRTGYRSFEQYLEAEAEE